MTLLGRVLMSLAIVVYTCIPPVADLLTHSHVFHPGWLPHARMHTVWLLGVCSSIGVVALYLLWVRKADALFNINLAAVLSLCVLGGFFISASTVEFYGGAFSDVLSTAGAEKPGPDANLVVFSLAGTVLLLGWWLARRSSP